MGFSVSGVMSRDRAMLAVTETVGAAVPRDEWSLRTMTTTAAVGLDAGRWARFWGGGVAAKFRAQNPSIFSGLRGSFHPYGWSAGCEIGRGLVSRPGAFLQLRASYMETLEHSGVLVVWGGTETYSDALKRSSIALLAGRSSSRAGVYCGARVTSIWLYRSRDTEVCELEEETDVGVVIGVEGKGAGASVFLEAGFVDVTGVTLGMRWSR
ncbi:MAG: hypothetical protein ACYS9X_13365 [Planctomycetota bacterium]